MDDELVNIGELCRGGDGEWRIISIASRILSGDTIEDRGTTGSDDALTAFVAVRADALIANGETDAERAGAAESTVMKSSSSELGGDNDRDG